MKYKSKVPCMPINLNNSFEKTKVSIGGKKNDSISSDSIEKKGIKLSK